MRDIKFRAWQKNHQKMGRVKSISFNEKQEIEHLCFHNGDNCAPVYSNYYLNHKEWDLSNLELMQFTGLHDKNGKEIYDGDVTKNRYVIMYNEEKALFAEHFYSTFQETWNLASYPISASDIEIIGNIQESPSLLKN